MALPIRPNNPNIPIPNNPFYAPLNPYVCGPYFPVDAGAGIDFTTGGIPAIVSSPSGVLAAGPGIALSTSGNTTTISAVGGTGGVTQIIAGTNVTISPVGGTGAVTINAAGGGGGGTVTSVTAGVGLNGGIITTTGTINLANTGVTAGSYTNANISVDAQGRITAAADGTPPPTSATPFVEGIVYGCTDCVNFNYGLGDNIFNALTTGTLNIAIGTGALATTDTGTSNTAIGIGALYNNTSGTQNVAVGQQVLFTNTTGTLNVAVGSQALQNSTGDANTALGNYAGNTVTTGCANILIGNQAGGIGGGSLDTGSDNVIIGNCIAPANSSGNCQLAIGAGTICWLTGNSSGAIKPGGGIIDCANSCGGTGCVLMSTGGNAICWGTPSSSVPQATPLVRGIVFGCSGTNNTSVGANALKSLTAGGSNTAVGLDALCSVTTGISNTAMGDSALASATGSQNTSVGGGSMFSNAAGDCNVAMGHYAMIFSSGSCNTALGHNSLRSVSGTNNVAVGISAGSLTTSGSNNVIIGPGVQAASATGSCQLAVGFSAADNWLTGTSTKAIKPGAGIIDCAGSCGTNGQVLMSNGSNAICWGTASGASAATPTAAGIVLGCTLVNNTALGCNALLAVPTGTFNTAVGASALTLVGAGCFNVGVGGFAVAANVTGCHNVGLGVNAARNALGSNNTVVGHNALFNATGGCNTVLGYQAGCSITTGGFNVAIGPEAQVASASGSCQLAIGFSLTDNWLTGDSTKAIRPGAGIIDCAGSCGTNGQVLMSNGSNAICWGSAAGAAATPTSLGTVYACTCSSSFFNVSLGYCANAGNGGSFGTAVGTEALKAVTSGGTNTGVGYQAGTAITGGQCNTVVGAYAGRSVTSGIGVTAIGRSALCVATGNGNVGLGAQVGNLVTSGSNNTLLGTCAGCNLTTGSNNVAIGISTALASAAGSCQLAIGFSPTDNWLTGTSTKAIKPGAGIIDCADTCGTAGQVLMSNGSNAICWGSISNATPTVTGIILGCTDATNAALGCNALLTNTGAGNVAIGVNAGCSLTTETCNVIVGGYAGAVGSNNTVSLADGAGSLKLHIGQFGGWSVDGSTGTVGSSGQVLTSSGPFGPPSWATISQYQTSAIPSSNLGPGGGSSLSTGFGPGLNSLTYFNNIFITLKIVDTVTSTVYNYLYNGNMYADGATPWTMSQLASNVLDNTGGRLSFLLDYDTGYQNKPRFTINYVSGNLMTVTGNIVWINLYGDYI